MSQDLSFHAASLSTSKVWPFETLPAFELPASQLRKTSGIQWLGFAPLLKQPSQVALWESYSVANQDWIDASLQFSGQLKNAAFRRTSIPSHIYRLNNQSEHVMETTGANSIQEFPVAPLWQISPAPLTAAGINYDALSSLWLQNPYQDLVTVTAQPMIYAVGDATVAVNSLSLELDATSNDSAPSTTTDEQYSVFLTPIYEQISTADASSLNMSNMVGLVLAITSWEVFLERELSTNVSGIQAVWTQTCYNDPLGLQFDTSFTYDIIGDKTRLVGKGDLHNDQYNDLKVAVPIGATNTSGGCTYSFSLYPTADFEKSVNGSNSTVVATCIAGALLLLVGISFFLFDHYVVRKQDELTSIAVKSNTVLATLFPASKLLICLM